MIQILQYFNICSFIYKQILLLIHFNSAAIDHFGFECVNPSNFGFVIAIGFSFWPNWRHCSWLFAPCDWHHPHRRPRPLASPLNNMPPLWFGIEIEIRLFDAGLKKKKSEINNKMKKKKIAAKQAKQYFPNFRARTRPRKRQNEEKFPERQGKRKLSAAATGENAPRSGAEKRVGGSGGWWAVCSNGNENGNGTFSGCSQHSATVFGFCLPLISAASDCFVVLPFGPPFIPFIIAIAPTRRGKRWFDKTSQKKKKTGKQNAKKRRGQGEVVGWIEPLRLRNCFTFHRAWKCHFTIFSQQKFEIFIRKKIIFKISFNYSNSLKRRATDRPSINE